VENLLSNKIGQFQAGLSSPCGAYQGDLPLGLCFKPQTTVNCTMAFKGLNIEVVSSELFKF